MLMLSYRDTRLALEREKETNQRLTKEVSESLCSALSPTLLAPLPHTPQLYSIRSAASLQF
jgi:hypothetical protein